MNNPAHIKIIKYFIVLLIASSVGAVIAIAAPAILGFFMNPYDNTHKRIMLLISHFMIIIFFFVPYSYTFLILKKKDTLSLELFVSKNNWTMKDFIKNHIKENTKIDLLIFVILSLPVMIFGITPFTAILAYPSVFFYSLIDIRIISYLISIIFFCIGYVLCLVLTYRRLIKNSDL